MSNRCPAALCLFALLLLISPAGALPGSQDEKPKEKPKADRELHVVGLYEGFTRSGDMIHGNKALVTVKRPGKNVTLVLTSYEPMTWELTVDKDTKIEKVILCGRKRGAVKGLPDRTELVGAFANGERHGLAVYAYKVDTPAFRVLVEALDREVGIPISSFTGAYRAEAGKPLVVDSVEKNELFSVDFPQVVPAAKLPKLTFQANHYVAGERFHDMTVSFGEYTLGGPKAATLKPLPDRVSRITYDPKGKKYFGIADHGLVEIDLEKQKYKKIEIGLEVPRISWPADLTYDTKRDRVLLITSGGPGYLYAYYPKTEKWEVMAERPPAVITYHPKDDVSYGIRGDAFREGGKGELLHINNRGAIVKSVKVDGPLLPGMMNLGPGVTGVQLVPAGDHLVMLVSPIGLRGGGERRGEPWSYIYLIDPKTGKTQLTWKSK
jgi:hypothetical protein